MKKILKCGCVATGPFHMERRCVAKKKRKGKKTRTKK